MKLTRPPVGHVRGKAITIVILPSERLDASIISVNLKNIMLLVLGSVQLGLGDPLLDHPPQRLQVTHSIADSLADVVVLSQLLLGPTKGVVVNLGHPPLTGFTRRHGGGQISLITLTAALRLGSFTVVLL